MRVSQVKELFRSLTATYFANAAVTFTKQTRVAKPFTPLVTLTFGNVRRPLHAVDTVIDGVEVASYHSRIAITVDLFTNGKPIINEENGETIAHENTALDDMLSFADFLSSQHVTDWCFKHDVSIGIDGDAQDLTGLVNDNTYEYRSRLNVMFYFTQQAVGYAGILGEDSILYPNGEDADGKPVYTPDKPEETTSTTGGFGFNYPVDPDNPNDTESRPSRDPIIIPTFNPSSSGGGSQDLVDSEVGYFTEAEIKEETGNE